MSCYLFTYETLRQQKTQTRINATPCIRAFIQMDVRNARHEADNFSKRGPGGEYHKHYDSE